MSGVVAESTAGGPTEPLVLPIELQHACIVPSLRHHARACSTALCALYDATVEGVALSLPPSRLALRRRLEAFGPALARVWMKGELVDDELVSWLLESRPRLRSLDVSNCERVTPAVLTPLRASKLTSWKAEFWTPHPLLSPEQVVRQQILALRENSGEGIIRCFGFASPGNQRNTGPAWRFGAMIRRGYDIMLRSPQAHVCRMPPAQRDGARDADRVQFLVLLVPAVVSPTRTDCPRPEQPAVFHWILAKQRAEWLADDAAGLAGCWLTDGVVPRGKVPLGSTLEHIKRMLHPAATQQEQELMETWVV